MQPQPYSQLTEPQLLTLCIWREARGEGVIGRRGVGWVIVNRVENPCWWGHDIHSVILKPYQFSSFNDGDPNSDKWPVDNSAGEVECQSIANAIVKGTDTDITDGATHYHDVSMGWPTAWGDQAQYSNTLNVGRFRFYRYLGGIRAT